MPLASCIFLRSYTVFPQVRVWKLSSVEYSIFVVVFPFRPCLSSFSPWSDERVAITWRFASSERAAATDRRANSASSRTMRCASARSSAALLPATCFAFFLVLFTGDGEAFCVCVCRQETRGSGGKGDEDKGKEKDKGQKKRTCEVCEKHHPESNE